jgi:predicted dehydrogenase
VITGVAIVGCGLIGRKRAVAFQECGVLVRAVYDARPDAATDLARFLGGHTEVASTIDEALVVRGVGLVVVATPHTSLVPVALDAVKAGLPVLVEKPGAASVEAARELARQARNAGVSARVGFNHRFHPSMLKARGLLSNGHYGGVMNIRARYGHGGRLGYEEEWRGSRALAGGGELLDQGIHLIDLVRYFVGDVDLAFAELRTDFWRTDVEDNAFVALRCRTGPFAWLHASWTEWKNLFSFEIAMQRAKVEIVGLGGSYGVERLTLYEMGPELGPPDTTSWEWPRGDDSWIKETDDVLRSLAGDGDTLGADVEDAIEALEIVEEAYRQ